MKRDLYEVLGVAKDATEDDIKKAYRKLARENHSDVNDVESDARMAEINGAYDVLGDPEKRRHYDETGDEEDVHVDV